MSSEKLTGLSWWAKRLDELKDHFTNIGLAGLLSHHRVTNRIGELLERGELRPNALESFLNHLTRGIHPIQMTNGWFGYFQDPRRFWQRVWKSVLGMDIKVPPVRKFNERQWEKIREYKLMLVYLPKISEVDYPNSFVRVDWNWFGALPLERLPLKGAWVLVEIIEVGHPIDHRGSDPLGSSLGRTTTRTGISWDHLEVNFDLMAKNFDLKCPVRFLSLEERNLIGNVFLWLNDRYDMQLPDLDGKPCSEWCQNSVGAGSIRPIAGFSASDGISSLDIRRSDLAGKNVSFRLLFEL